MTAKHKHTEKNIMEVLDKVEKALNKPTTSNDIMVNNYVDDNKEDNKSDKPKQTEVKTNKVDLKSERDRLLAEILKIDGITATECKTYTSIKSKGKCILELYRGVRKFSIAICDRYVDNELKSLGKLTTQKFHNNLYITISPESNFEKIMDGLLLAINLIITEMSQQIKLKEKEVATTK